MCVSFAFSLWFLLVELILSLFCLRVDRVSSSDESKNLSMFDSLLEESVCARWMKRNFFCRREKFLFRWRDFSEEKCQWCKMNFCCLLLIVFWTNWIHWRRNKEQNLFVWRRKMEFVFDRCETNNVSTHRSNGQMTLLLSNSTLETLPCLHFSIVVFVCFPFNRCFNNWTKSKTNLNPRKFPRNAPRKQHKHFTEILICLICWIFHFYFSTVQNSTKNQIQFNEDLTIRNDGRENSDCRKIIFVVSRWSFRWRNDRERWIFRHLCPTMKEKIFIPATLPLLLLPWWSFILP